MAPTDFNHPNSRPQNPDSDPAPVEIQAKVLPRDYVDKAETLLHSYINPETGRQGRNQPCISSSKLRNLLSLSSAMYNREILLTAPQMSAASVAGVNQMRIRVAYECGRDPATKAFVQKARLLEYLKRLAENHENSRTELLDFAHYMEALVAYHRFYGLKGKED